MASAEPMAKEVCDGIHALPLRTPTLPPATHTNAYLVGTRERVLVEPASPYADEIERCARWVEDSLRGGGSLRALLLTHHHPDHVGGATALAERFGVPIWAHAGTRALLEGRVTIDRELEDGEGITLSAEVPMQLEALFTPGHAPGHLCFVEPRSGCMIAGDMVAEVGTIEVAPGDGDMRLYLQSLDRMAARAPSALLPAHGEALRDPQTTLAFYKEHRLAREAKVLAALRHYGDVASARDLLPLCYADKPKWVWPMAERSTAAHLIKLEHDGLARREAGGWIRATPGA